MSQNEKNITENIDKPLGFWCKSHREVFKNQSGFRHGKAKV